jgi:hypothetical protein
VVDLPARLLRSSLVMVELLAATAMSKPVRGK